MTLNEISNPNDNNQDNPVEIATYDKLRHVFRYHWAEGRKQARSANECINSMVIILYQENPDWSISKIANKIAIDNQDLEGFSKSTIYNNLNEENRMLLDTSKQNRNKVPEQSVPALEQKDISPIQTKEGLKYPIPKKEYEKFKKWDYDNNYAHKEVLINGRIKRIPDRNQPIDERSKEYVQAHEDENERYELINGLIMSLSNLTPRDQSHIIANKSKTENSNNKLAEASYDYMVKVSKQMITSDINLTLNYLRTLRYLEDQFVNILFDEQELRKNKEKKFGT